MRTLATFLLSCAGVAFAGCAVRSTNIDGRTTVVPPAIRVGDVAPLRGGAPIAVVAGPAADEWFVLAPSDPDRIAANLRVWSDEAAAGVRRDLQTLGATIDAAAQKQIEVTVTRVVGEVGFAKARVTVTLQITTGDGVASVFTHDTSSVRRAVFCSEDAMRKAILAALSDGRVRAYLES